MRQITNYREPPEQSPEEVLAGAANIDDARSRLRRKKLVDELKNRATKYLAVFDEREEGGPSLDEAKLLAEDFERILSKICQ